MTVSVHLDNDEIVTYGEVNILTMWNPWHGCHKISPGCQNCYVYRRDEQFGKDSSVVNKTGFYDLPMKFDRQRQYKIQGPDTVYTCLTSDFFLEDADMWRSEAWKMMNKRKDLFFFIITKRIHRFQVELPPDWGEGYENVAICCTVENQMYADKRLPIFLNEPIKHKSIICEPILDEINLIPYLNSSIEQVVVGGESGDNGRICSYNWVLDIRNQCMKYEIPFYFKQTGTHFRKDGKIYTVQRKYQQSQASKAKIDIT